METKKYTTIDRAILGWPSGPWDNEPDKMQRSDSTTGLPCLAVRHRTRGHWCGYVGLPPDHPLHGKGYSEEGVDFNVHGGITYSALCAPEEIETQGICHVPEPGEPEHVWWFGFDCAHAWDFSPQDKKYADERGYPFTLSYDETYRTLDYVQSQCSLLARQVAGNKENSNAS